MAAPIPPDQDLQQRLLAAEDARRTAEDALNESQRLARIGSWTWLVEPDAVTWSEEMFRIAGRDPALGAPSYAEQSTMYLPPERLAQAVAGTLTTGQPFETEVALVRPQGDLRWIVARGAAIKDERGVVVRVHGTVRDITEARAQRLALQAAHDSLERSERRYRDLVESAGRGSAWCGSWRNTARGRRASSSKRSPASRAEGDRASLALRDDRLGRDRAAPPLIYWRRAPDARFHSGDPQPLAVPAA